MYMQAFLCPQLATKWISDSLFSYIGKAKYYLISHESIFPSVVVPKGHRKWGVLQHSTPGQYDGLENISKIGWCVNTCMLDSASLLLTKCLFASIKEAQTLTACKCSFTQHQVTTTPYIQPFHLKTLETIPDHYNVQTAISGRHRQYWLVIKSRRGGRSSASVDHCVFFKSVCLSLRVWLWN